MRHDDAGAWIRSRSAIAAELSLDRRDRRRLGVKIAALRRLGVKIAALTMDGVEVPIDHPALQLGWHAPEPDGRWTDAAALIPAALLRGTPDASITLVSRIRYREPLAA